ncbi:threonine aspartase 1 [Tribolium castaneum]|uniref:Putative isoaspartyl peptidase/L-asparaginase CG7860-like protein n=1 Tax=Tribolium castaneum TaxID=7070 RepID=A0A139WB85_TRICA|nr:PREDICTED: threonine aspartase 1 [Tribolium castaneum]KYB25153.1 putative isoaspartyl peptidase/L-asparaginase CG7860-like protein [Tribolium castaneum]|eukprot:XP_973095.1 PREDICTED: threonine aspartase 1 [Tribolium castaneum]
MSGIVAVHCGAGTHSSSHYVQYNKLSKKACRKGIEVLQSGGTALEAVKVVIAVLENDPLTNCGYGSNLTNEGTVETDASIMDGKTLLYGGCGALKNVKNPIELAYDICVKQVEPLPFGLIPPSFLVGRGALQFARSSGLKIVSQKALVSAKALKQYRKYQKLLDSRNNELLDTVGAVCVDNSGHVAAGCSSGGILLKRPGRVGQAAVYASGAWADSFSPETENSVAVCTSGCGEHLMRTQLAKEIAEDVKSSACPTIGLSQSITDKFLNSRFLKNVSTKLCGALVLHIDNKTGDSAVLWAHTTESMSIGFMKCGDENPKALISELPTGVSVGTKVNVSGIYNYRKKSE